MTTITRSPIEQNTTAPQRNVTSAVRQGLLFRHSAKDAYLVFLSLVNVAAIVGTAVLFDVLSLPTLALMALYFVYMVCTNYQCIAHNHLHNPFFRSDWLNNLFSAINSLALGMSQTLYRVHHLNHHVYNSDFRNPQTGQTSDWSSLYRHSKRPDKPESIFLYSSLGVFRINYAKLWRQAKKKQWGGLLWWEHGAMLLFYGALAWINWQFLVFYFLPVMYLGQACALAENYLEHYGADPTNRKANSVSCYSRFYNWIWFNNGYHQEHHYRPQVHWTMIPTVKSMMLPESERRVVRGCHLGNLFGR